MMSRSRTRKIILALTTVGILGALAFHRLRFAPIAVFVVGSWTSDTPMSTVVTTFKRNGDFEKAFIWKPGGEMGDTFDDSSGGVGVPLVYKGRYSTSGATFRIFDVQRYLRHADDDSNDIAWEPCSDWEGHRGECISDGEILQMDRQTWNPDYVFTIVSADWWSGQMTTRHSHSGQLEPWKR